MNCKGRLKQERNQWRFKLIKNRDLKMTLKQIEKKKKPK